MENNSTAAPNAQQPSQAPLNPASVEKLTAFLDKQAYIMRQLNVMFDVLMQAQNMEIDLSSFASIGWDITSQSIDEYRDIGSTAHALGAAKGGVNVSVHTASQEQASFNHSEQISVNKRELVDLLDILEEASEAFDQLDTLLKTIANNSLEHETKNLAALGQKITLFWSSTCDSTYEDFKYKHILDNQGGK